MAAMRLYFLFLCGFLASVSCVRKLNSIDDLRNTGYGRPPPRHGLRLLFWFAQRVEVDQNNNIRLSFDPTTLAFGFHYFGNRNNDGTELLPSLNYGQRYFEVGNLGNSASALPEYVMMFYRNTRQLERNMDRLMISLDRNRPNRIFRVFITAHNRNSNDFNGDATYEIDPALIRQIRGNHPCPSSPRQTEFTEGMRCEEFLQEFQDTSINYCRNNELRKRSIFRTCTLQAKIIPDIKLDLKTGTNGNTIITWDNIPDELMSSPIIVICGRGASCYPSSGTSIKITASYGRVDTSILLNGGLRLELLDSSYNLISQSSEFDEANGVIPKRIKGTDASLQLYVIQGRACARLYIKKTFTNWKDVFNNAWIGFYKSSTDKNEDYKDFQFAVKFEDAGSNADDYNIYYYVSKDLTIAPGFQIRLLQGKNYNNVFAQTLPWEADQLENAVCGLRPELSPPFSDPEFFNDPELSDANDVMPIQLNHYWIGLQLFTKDLKACARLYVRRNSYSLNDSFYHSWVGFYGGSQTGDKDYSTFQYVVNFVKKHRDTENFDVYEYESQMDIADGVQIRLWSKNYSYKLGETVAWKSDFIEDN